MKKWILILPVALLFSSCISKKKEIVIPGVYADKSEQNFTTGNGITFLHDQPFSGWQYALYENGDTALLISFYNGRQSGIAKEWYPGKKIRSTGGYANGNRTGEHRGWWENGQLQFIHHYAGDLFEGRQEEWYPDGSPYKVLQYAAGHEKGLQRIWRPDGRLHANYEVRNGRNYGLTGSMHCKNNLKDGM